MRKLLLLSFIVPASVLGQSPLQYVDPLIGTAPATTESARKHSEAGSELKGQTFPAVGRPFGMTQWTPETRTTETKCISPYYYNDKVITGFRGSHWMSGSCTQDYGSVSLMPFSSESPDTVKTFPVSAYSHAEEISTPAYYKVVLKDYNITAEVSAHVRSAVLRFKFAGKDPGNVFIRSNSDENQGKLWIDVSRNEICGYNPVHRIYQGWGKPAGFSGYFVIRLNCPFKLVPVEGNRQHMIISLGSSKEVLVKVGTSFTSIEAARNNLDSEIGYWNFDKLRRSTEKVWNETLSKIEVEGPSKEDKIKFYTALYHCYQLPRVVSDVDGSYQGFAQDTLIHKAGGFDYYDDFSMWDTYRALHPLMTILEPERSCDMVKSLVAKAEQGGWMPIFPAWGSYTAAMIGDHVSTMVADAYLRGITNFDVEKAYSHMRKNAFEIPSVEEYKDGKGRRALASYLKYGYIPLEDSVWDAFHKREQVSRTLEYALDDYALSQFAQRLGKMDDYNILLKRSQNYRNVFDTTTMYVRAKHANGTWVEHFDPFAKSFFICEGTSFQYTWYVPQDIPGLIGLMGGKERFISHLNKFFEEGHYWHGNEPDHQAAYLFAMAGNISKTQEWVRRIIAEDYGIGPGGLSGNEDAGQMSAWLVCSMMGFYPVCPGKPEYVLGIPSFNKIMIHPVKGQKPFLIMLKDKNASNSGILLNGHTKSDYILKHEEIISGGQMIIE
ncbi:MAG TPA: GH92 family glycosyl hydrolase [Bacteroidales bacterium]|nr:GH92 family glycosyl hydrolase [Bacteroidales bacterium]